MRYLVFPMILSSVLVGGCREPQTATGQRDVRTVDIVPLALPPVSTFEAACARCHGPEGSFYGPGFAEPAEAQLAVVVRDMMEGPAFLTPSDADVDAMVAYHRALAADEPFLCVTAYEPATATTPGRVQGQATPGAEVSFYTVSAPHYETQADKQGAWEIARLPGDDLTLAAASDGKTTVLSLAHAQWSHGVNWFVVTP